MRAFPRSAIASALLCTVWAAGVARVHAQDCQPGLQAEYTQAPSAYDPIVGVLVPRVPALAALMRTLSAGSYPALLSLAEDIADDLLGLRIQIALQDGTPVLDTDATNNTFVSFQNRRIGSNLHSLQSVFAAQLYPCGAGIQRTFLTSQGSFVTALAIRLDIAQDGFDHLNSLGTVLATRP